jgi:hypothetical protein
MWLIGIYKGVVLKPRFFLNKELKALSVQKKLAIFCEIHTIYTNFDQRLF